VTLGVDEFESRFGRYLYELLPAVYRERDNTLRDPHLHVERLGDLARYLDAFGLLLDRLRGMLDQRFADAFPDNQADGRACQDWLIPYFARLFDVRLFAASVAGQRDEVRHAIRWRQSKGALPAVEEIGEAVLESEVELQEGWRRVALTARVGVALLPPPVYGIMRALDERNPSEVTRHPGLPAVTPDLRCASRAVQTSVASLAVKTSRLAGARYRFRQANPHGVPVAPGSFDDVSRRTVDLRTAPSATSGHAHPRRLLVYAPVPFGLVPPPAKTLTWVEARTSPRVGWTLEPATRELVVRNLSTWSLVIEGDVELPADAGADVVTLEDLRVRGRIRVNQGRLRLRRVVATEVVVQTVRFDPAAPVLDARDSILGTLDVRSGYVDLERTTVRRAAFCGAVRARNSIFAGALSDGAGHAPSSGDLRYCRVPPELATLPEPPPPPGGSNDLPLEIDESCTTAAPRFFASDADDPAAPLTPDAGVLTPECPEAIRFGADAGGELGAYHSGRLRPVVVARAQTITMPRGRRYELRDLVFASKLEVHGETDETRVPTDFQPLVLERVAARELEVVAASPRVAGRPAAVLEARSTLLEKLGVGPGSSRLEYCTLLGSATFAGVQASDCVFAGSMRAGGTGGAPDTSDCLRYSRLPPEVLALTGSATGLRFPSCVDERPVFFESDFGRALSGAAGLGVLHPAAPKEICFGAEDGGEIGAFHEARHCLSRVAVSDKLAEHLSVGVEPVVIPDFRLHVVPPLARE
jgi:hypothetical protein